MTLGSCKAKKQDMVGAGPQKMAVNLRTHQPTKEEEEEEEEEF